MANQKDPACDGMGNCFGDHCCYVNGAPCPFLLIDDPALAPRKYACGLVHELGNWQRVEKDPRYLQQVKPHWDASGTIPCKDYPGDPQTIRAAVLAGEITNEWGCCLTRDLPNLTRG